MKGLKGLLVALLCVMNSFSPALAGDQRIELIVDDENSVLIVGPSADDVIESNLGGEPPAFTRSGWLLNDLPEDGEVLIKINGNSVPIACPAGFIKTQTPNNGAGCLKI